MGGISGIAIAVAIPIANTTQASYKFQGFGEAEGIDELMNCGGLQETCAILIHVVMSCIYIIH